MKNSSLEIKLGAILSYLQMGVSILLGLLYTPVMLRLLGPSEYGLYNTVSSTIAMMSVLNLGFNGSYIRFYSKYKNNKNQEAIDKLNGLFLIIFTIIAVVTLVCGFFLTNNLDFVFADGLTESEYEIARVLMFLLTISLAISFPMSVFVNIITAHEKFVFLKTLNILKTVAGPLVTLPLLLMGYRSIAMVSVTLAISLVTDLVYVYYTLAVIKSRFSFRNFDKQILRELFGFTFFIALESIVDQVNWNIGKLMLGRFRGTVDVAIYAVGYSLFQYYMIFSTAISGVFTPRIHQLVNSLKDNPHEMRTKLTDLFTRVGRVQFIILALIATGVIFFGKTFIVDFWAGAGYDDSYYVALLLMLPSTVALIQNLGIEVQRAQNKHQFRSLVYLAMALMNLMLSVALCQRFGAVGSAVGTAISLIVANGIVMNIYYHKKCHLDILYFWKSILQLSLGLVIPVIAGTLLTQCFIFDSPICFALAILVYVAIYCVSMWFFGMNSYEKCIFGKLIKKILRMKG